MSADVAAGVALGEILPSVLGGTVIGALFFGGLWLTVRRIPRSRHPALLMFSSLILRLALAGAGFYWVMDGSAVRLLSALAGFLAVRWVLTGRLARLAEARALTRGEG